MNIKQELADTNMSQRCSLIIYLSSVSNQYKLRRYGDIVYFSKKMGYCVLYVNRDKAERIIQELTSLDFVNKVEKSNWERIDLSSNHIEQQITDLAAEAEKKLQENQEKNTEKLS